jgi:hypothetical protein
MDEIPAESPPLPRYTPLPTDVVMRRRRALYVILVASMAAFVAGVALVVAALDGNDFPFVGVTLALAGYCATLLSCGILFPRWAWVAELVFHALPVTALSFELLKAIRNGRFGFAVALGCVLGVEIGFAGYRVWRGRARAEPAAAADRGGM